MGKNVWNSKNILLKSCVKRVKINIGKCWVLSKLLQ